MNNLIDEKRKKRFQYLHALYEYTDGDQLKSIHFAKLGESIGFSPEESDQISDYLAEEGLLKLPLGGYITIEHKGIKEIEDALSKPQDETKYFPSIIIMGNVSDSNIQVGNNNQVKGDKNDRTMDAE